MKNIVDEIEIGSRAIIGNEQALQFLNLDKSVKNITLTFNIQHVDNLN